MTNDEKECIKILVDAFNSLPESKKEYLLGYAEGMAATSMCSAAAQAGPGGA